MLVCSGEGGTGTPEPGTLEAWNPGTREPGNPELCNRRTQDPGTVNQNHEPGTENREPGTENRELTVFPRS
jgi:hypothetical protein